MFSKYLSHRIQAQTLDFSKDYTKLKSYLISNYGNAPIILMELIEKMEKKRKPTRDGYRDWFQYFSDLQNILVKIDRLTAIHEVDSKDLELHLHSCLTMKRFVDMLPPDAKSDFTRLLKERKLDQNSEPSDGEIGKPIGPERIPIARILGTEVDLELKLWKS